MFANFNKQKQFKGYNDYPVEYKFLGFGEDVSYNTMSEMKRIIKESSKNWIVIQTARNIVQNENPKDRIGEVTAIYNWVRNKTRYIMDPAGTEHLQTPLVAIDMIRQGQVFQGDCDDLTILVLSLLKAIGYNVKMIAAAYSPKKNLTHIYGAVYLINKWVIVEPIKLNVPLGWEAPNKTRKVEMII